MDKREWMLQAVLAIPQRDEDGTDDHVKRLAYTYDTIVAVTPEPEDHGWIEHHGAKPYPEGMVDVTLRDGTKRVSVDSDELIWTHEDYPGDIVAWRPA